jgi:tetrahydromethanopterin S-methyltransferase subunit G
VHAHPLEARIANLEGTFAQVNERLGSIERRLDSIDGRFNWLIGLVLGTWMTTIGTILFHR